MDMLKDKEERDELFTIAEENMPNFEDIDTDSVKSESGGCQFILLKGKNKGNVCGKPRSAEDRCPRHEDK